ncbi:MAG: S8 family serine peptidase [Acidobacteriota bacterium]
MLDTLFLILLCSLFVMSSCTISSKKRSERISFKTDDVPVVILTETSSPLKTSEQFAKVLQEASSSQKFKVLFDFREQLDLVNFKTRLNGLGLSKSARRDEVIKALNILSDRKEKEIRPIVESLMERGEIEYFKKFSIVNRFYAVASASAIRALAAREDIARVIEEYHSASERAGSQYENIKEIEALQGDITENWALKIMGAEKVWAMGFDGSGVVVGSLDTGVWLHHEQLRKNFRGGDKSWFDPVTGTSEPFDSKGHGTGVLSCASGRNENRKKIGVAPGSTWVAALANHKNFYNNIHMTCCADWMLNVAKPDVIVNAWSHSRSKCKDFDLDFINAWKAAEIFPVFAAGNQGPSHSSSESPADLPSTFPGGVPAFSVGSVNAGKEVSSFSSRGPSRCSGEIFPMVVAPGEDVFFAFPIQSNSYMTYSGTSAASGYAAGAVAILIQKYPEMSVEDLERLLKNHAVDLGSPGPDNESGFGLIYLPDLIRSQW